MIEAKELEKWKRLEEEARRIRRDEADWDFIERQPPKIKERQGDWR